MRLIRLLSLVLFLSLFACQAGNLVLDPGFESGGTAAWTFVPAAQGSSLAFAHQGFGPHDGNLAAEFGGTSAGDYDTILQAIPTTPGQSYQFSFWMGTANSANSGEQVLWDGTVLLSGSVLQPVYTQYSFIEVATTSSTTISFGAYNIPSFTGLDDVDVEEYVEDTAPEPGSWLFALSGIAAVWRWKRHQAGAPPRAGRATPRYISSTATVANWPPTERTLSATAMTTRE